jgi:hypothetical protein
MPPTTNTPTRDRTDTGPAEAWLRNDSKPTRTARLRGSPRRRSVPHLALGVVLVLACAAATVFAALQFTDRQQVLALARPVTVGHVLTTEDLRQVSVSAAGGVSVVPAGQVSVVVGQTMAVSLPAGSLLTPTELGAAALPQPGQAITALALKPGQFPTALGPGAHVLVVLAPGSTSGGSPTSAGSPSSAQQAVAVWPATVTDLAGQANDQSTVVSVQLADTAARQVAAQPSGALSLVLVSGGQ